MLGQKNALRVNFKAIFLRFFTKSLIATSLIFFHSTSFSFVNPVGQVIRYQSVVLKGKKSFTSKGSASIGEKKLSSVLTWLNPMKYQLQISSIPKSFYLSEEGSNSWTLIRDAKGCTLKTDNQVVGCSPPSTWALLELSASAELVSKSLRQNKFLSDDDIGFSETDGKSELSSSGEDRKSLLHVGQNGSTPVAVIEIRGMDFNGEKSGQEYPLLHFDQSFLAPLLVRNQVDGELITWKAASDIEVSREKNRFNHILSSRLEIYVGESILASFSRQNPAELSKSVPFGSQKTLGDVTALKNNLSTEGQNFLKALLLSH